MAKRGEKRFLKFLFKGGLFIASIAVVLALAAFVQTLIKVDPFAKLKKTTGSLDPQVGADLRNVQIESFHGEHLVTQAVLGRMTIQADRQSYAVYNVVDGVFFTDNGKKVRFRSPSATWDVPKQELTVQSGAHLKNKDIDIDVPQFAYDQNSSQVTVPGQVTGMLFKGNVKAASLTYNVKDSSMKTGALEWEGKFAISFQDDNAKPRKWQIKANGMTSQQGDILTYENGYGTDGDIIVMADSIEQNRKTDIVTAIGNVRYFSSKANMVCDKAVIERKIKKATLPAVPAGSA